MKIERHAAHRATPFMFDPVLGWRMRPNNIYHHEVGPLAAVMTVGPDGNRWVPGQPKGFDKDIWVFGCSLTFGILLQDHETYCALLQARFPDFRIRSLGLNGYSNFQNLLQLEAELVVAKPDVVIFTVIPDHRRRNVGHPEKYIDTQRKGISGPTMRPIGQLDCDGSLIFARITNPGRLDLVPKEHLQWNPGSYWMDMISGVIFDQARALVKTSGGQFLLAILLQEDHMKNDPVPEEKFRRTGFDIINAAPSGPYEEITFLPHDPHPNQASNRHYADVIGDKLETVL